MKLTACMLTHNDAWVIGASARAALRYCDDLVVGRHRSSDGADDILTGIAWDAERGRVQIVEQDALFPAATMPIEQIGGYLRREHIGRIAIERGATHVLVIDSDEILTANVAAVIRELTAASPIVYLPWIQVWDQPDQYRTTWDQMIPFTFPVDEWSHWVGSVHGRWPAHVSAAPYPPSPHVAYGVGGAMHLQFLSRERLAWKRLMYRLGERIMYPACPPADIDRKFADGIVPPLPAELALMPAAWWAGLEDLRAHLHSEMRPWHQDECRRLVQKHGRGILAGLDLGTLSLEDA